MLLSRSDHVPYFEIIQRLPIPVRRRIGLRCEALCIALCKWRSGTCLTRKTRGTMVPEICFESFAQDFSHMGGAMPSLSGTVSNGEGEERRFASDFP